MYRKIRYIIIWIACGAFFTIHGYCADKAAGAFRYEAKGKRDPFFPLVGQERVLSSGLENIISIEDVALEGIAVGSGGRNVAILNGQMVKEKDKFGVLCIKKISRKTVELSIEGKDYILDLQEEGKKGGKQ